MGVPVVQPRPCSSTEAVQRALSLVGKGGQYWLGTGDYRPRTVAGQLVDQPWTSNNGGIGSDCCGFAVDWCYKLPRHRPGYNVGSWSSCSDDINCNSAIEDAEHARDLFEIADRPMPGDLIAYPTIYTKDGLEHVGHVGIIVAVNRCAEWDPTTPQYYLLDVVQVCGPNGRMPAAIRTDGSVWDHHDVKPFVTKPEHKTRVLRARP